MAWMDQHHRAAASELPRPPGPPSPGHFSIGFSQATGVEYRLRVELCMRDGARWWPYVEARRAEIDSALGPGVSWEPIEEAERSRVAVYFGDVDPDDRDAWPEYRSWAIETLGKFREVFQPILDAAPQ